MATITLGATAARSGEPASPASLGPAGVWSALALIAAAIVLRLPHFGHPAFDIDEEFYLLVGDRMLHGALPYVDIWDRKPIGLFLIYAAIRLLGGQGFVQYQIVAAVFAGGTAWMISRLARAVTGELPAILSGMAYLVWIETLGGGGGQSPVFYNLPVAAAAWLTWQALSTPRPDHRWQSSLGAMLLIGLAIQIKYTAMFEGALFGLLLAIRHLRTGRGADRLWRSLALLLLAWLPTLAAGWFYAANHAFAAFYFANFGSILLRNVTAAAGAHQRLVIEAEHLAPLAICCAASTWLIWRRGDAQARRWLCFIGLWSAAALAGFASVGAYFYHYTLPLFVPLAVGAAPIFAYRPIGAALAAVVLGIPFSNLNYPAFGETRIARAEMDRLVAHLPADVGRHCLYVYDGPPSLFLTGRACALSRFVFPDHLASLVEAGAVGVDPAAEVQTILARKPAAITINEQWLPMRNPRTFRPVRDALARDYRFATSAWDDGKTIALYVRK